MWATESQVGELGSTKHGISTNHLAEVQLPPSTPFSAVPLAPAPFQHPTVRLLPQPATPISHSLYPPTLQFPHSYSACHSRWPPAPAAAACPGGGAAAGRPAPRRSQQPHRPGAPRGASCSGGGGRNAGWVGCGVGGLACSVRVCRLGLARAVKSGHATSTYTAACG